jgi:hypothetical protein
MENSHGKHISHDAMERFIQYAIIVLVAALVFLAFFLVRDYRALRRAHVISSRVFLLNMVVKNHGHLTAGDVTVIRPWMTFDYIDRLFGLPADYLKAQLSIADSRYPKLSLSGFAKSERVTSAVIVNEVEVAVTGYFATSTPAVASSTGT